MKDVGVIWSAGARSYEKTAGELRDKKWNGSIYLSPFIEKIEYAYAAGDIALSRSGAGVMMEIASAGLPSVLLPYPHAADNHQEVNADVFHNAGASIKIGKGETTPEKVGQILIDLLNNPAALERMSDKALSVAKTNASEGIVDKVIEGFKIQRL